MIALNETNEYAAEVPFTLPLATDPLTGLTGWTFSLGEVQIRLPGSLIWINVLVSKIVEKGYGRFCARLTASQTNVAGIVAIRVAVAGTQPYFGSETIGTLGGDIPQNGAGYVLFFLPDAVDPVYGSPITGANFAVSGLLRICLPNATYRDCTVGELASVINLGFGGYALPLDASLTVNAGKVFVYAEYPGAQRFEGYSTILGTGIAPAPPTPPGPDPIPSPITVDDPEFVDHVAAALDRLPEQFKFESTGEVIIVDLPPPVYLATVDTGVPSHIEVALGRLPQQFRSGDVFVRDEYDIPLDAPFSS